MKLQVTGPPEVPPRDNIYRSGTGPEVRAAATGDGTDLVGHFAVFNTWTEINSMWEGNFLERFAPGAFTKTFQENRDRIRVLFQHGYDPQVGDKPLGAIRELREDEDGAYYEVPLLMDADYVRDGVLPGLRAGLYGASFRFRALREDFNKRPEESDYNPHGIPERTVKEAQVMEFGPVTFPAYKEATAGVRSLTDHFTVLRFNRDPEHLDEVMRELRADETDVDNETTGDGGDMEATAPGPGPTRHAPDLYLTTTKTGGTPKWRL